MNEREKFRNEVMVDLLISDHETGGRPKLPPGTRDQAAAAFQELLVDPTALDEHVHWLQERRRKDESMRARHSELLADTHVEAVLARGVAGLDDSTLAALLLNPIAIYGLYDEIGERLPSAWLTLMQAEGRAMMDRLGVKVRIPQPLQPPVPELLLSAAAWPLQAFGVGLTRNGDSAAPVEAAPAEPLAWSVTLGDALDGGRPVPLPSDAAEHWFGADSRVRAVRLTLQASACGAGTYQPVLIVQPGPTHSPMVIELRFPATGESCRFSFAPDPNGSLREARAEADVAVSAQALNLTSDADRASPRNKLHLELACVGLGE